MKQSPYDWTDERIQATKAMWKDGKSASEIAEVLGAGITRNAVLGRLNRMGLARSPAIAHKDRQKPIRKARPDAETIIRQRHAGGSTVSDIASACRMPVSEVRAHLTAIGFDPEANEQPIFQVNQVWGMEEQQRRIAFAKKAQKGARAALKAFTEPSVDVTHLLGAGGGNG